MPSKSREFAAYVSRLIFRNPARTITPPQEAEGTHFPAVALFADVAGSTKMANQLAKLGRLIGPEEMCRILNAYYSPLITLIHARGGDVIGFAGDAVLAVWPVSESTPFEVCVQQATQAACEIQEQLNNQELAPGIRLSLRICIGAGELSTALVGGQQGYWQLIAYGAPLDQIREAGDQVPIGSIYLSPAAFTLLNADATAEVLSDGGAYVKQLTIQPEPLPASTHVNELPEEVLRPYVPRVVQDSIDANLSDYLDQSRTISTLFVRIFRPAGFAPSWERMQGVMAVLQDAMTRYEGTVAQLMEDDKGLIAVLAFGLPPVSHEDDVSRSLAAASFLVELARAREVSCGIGVSTGVPFCGPLGSGERRVYTVTGADVIRAARLMQLAYHGEILCDEETMIALGKTTPHRLVALPRFDLKGFDTPVRVFRASTFDEEFSENAGHDIDSALQRLCHRIHATSIGPRLLDQLRDVATDNLAGLDPEIERLIGLDRLLTTKGICELTDGPIVVPRPADQSRSGRLIGRSVALATIEAALKVAETGGCCIVFIEGDVGIGKSRLLEEAQARARNRGMVQAVGYSTSVETATPYFPWRGLLEDLLSLKNITDPAERTGRVMRTLQSRSDLVPFAPTLNNLLGLNLAEERILQEMSGRTRADNLNKVVLGILEVASGGRPMLLIFEDAHWADSATWRLIGLVREHLRGVVVGISIRTSDAFLPPPEYAQIRAKPDTNCIVLAPLAEKDTRELARLRFGADRLDEALASMITSRTLGNPLFIEQIVDHVRAIPLVEIHCGTARLNVSLGHGQASEIPNTIRGLVTARIDRLRPSQQLTAKVTGVIGPVFPWRVVQAIHPESATRSDLPEHAAALIRERVLRQDQTDPDAVYAFLHPVVQQVCYELLTRPQRRRFHQAAAEWFTNDHSNKGAIQDRLLAHHWAGAGVTERQIECLARAGEHALRDGAFREAVTSFQELIRLSQEQSGNTPDPQEIAAHAHWECQLGEAYFGIGELPAAAEHLRSSLTLRGLSLYQTPFSLGLDIVRQVVRQLAHRLGLRDWIKARSENPTTTEMAATFNRLGRIYYYKNDILAGTSATLHALNLAETGPHTPALATAYASMMILSGLLNWSLAARTYARLAEVTAREVGHAQHLSVILAYLCMHKLALARWDDVARLAHESLDLAERLRDHHQISETAVILAMLHCFRGSYHEAEVWAGRMIEQSKHSGNTIHSAWAANIEGECLFRRGYDAEAQSRLTASESLLQGKNDRTEEIRIQGLLAAVAARKADWSAAEQHTAAAIAIMNQISAITCSTLEGFAGIADARFSFAESHVRDKAAQAQARISLIALKKYTRLYPMGEPRLALYEGRLQLLLGSPQRAITRWQKGLATATVLQMPFELATLHFWIGRTLPANSSERRQHFTAAAEGFETTDASYDLRRLKQMITEESDRL